MKKKGQGYSILELNFNDIRVVCHPVQHPLPADLQQRIEQYWSKLNGKHLFNGSLARLDSWYVEKNTLILNTSITDYRTLLYSNSHISDIAGKWGKKYSSRALGISALVITQDQFLILMRRSNNVGEYRNCIDVFGGHVDMEEKDVAIDLRQAMLKELEEELGLSAADVNLEYNALIQCNAHHKPELLFTATTSLSIREIIAKSHKALDRFEYTRIIIIPLNRQAITGFLKWHAQFSSPSAYASMELYIHKVQR